MFSWIKKLERSEIDGTEFYWKAKTRWLTNSTAYISFTNYPRA